MRRRSLAVLIAAALTLVIACGLALGAEAAPPAAPAAPAAAPVPPAPPAPAEAGAPTPGVPPTVTAAEINTTATAPPGAGALAGEASPVPKSLSIDDAIRIAVSHNPSVAISRQEIRANAGLLMQAGSATLPHASITEDRFQPVHPSAIQSSRTIWSTNLNLGWTFFTWGAFGNRIRAARNSVAASVNTYHRTQEQIAFSVRQAYYQVLTAQEAVSVAQDVLAAAQEHLRVARLRYQTGVAPEFDVLSAAALVAQDQQSLISANGGLNVAWAGLSRQLGVPVPAGTVLSTPRPTTLTSADLPALMDEAFANRHDLRAAKYQAEAAKRNLQATRVGNLPTLDVSMGYTFQPSTSINLGPGQSLTISQNSGQIVLAASWPAFDGGLVAGETQSAKARLEQARQTVQQTKDQIQLDVRTAYFNLQSAQAQIPAAESEVAQQQEAVRIANLRYQEGVGTSVEVTDAETNLAGARTRLNQAIFGLNVAVSQLDLAVGRELPTQAPSATVAGPQGK